MGGFARLEKGYRMWGTDITTEHDPDEAGLGFDARSDEGEFVGREALELRTAEGPRRRMLGMLRDEGVSNGANHSAPASMRGKE